MAAIPGVVYTLDPTTKKLKAKGRPDVDASGRGTLVYGTYVPGASTTGPVAALTPIYVSQAGVASTNFANGYGGEWKITSAMAAQTVVVDGVTRQMVVLENLDIHGMLDFRVPTLVRNCKTRGRAGGTKDPNNWWAGARVQYGGAGSYIVDTEMTVDEPTELHIAGPYGFYGITTERVNVHGGTDLARLWGAANEDRGSWWHDMVFINGTYAPQPEGPHCDVRQYAPNVAYTGVQRIIGSYLDARVPGHPVNTTNNGPSCLMIPGSTSTGFNLEVLDSWLEWGWFPINSGGTPHVDSTILLRNVKARPGWFTRNGITYHEVSTSAWNAKTTRINCTDWDTGGAWRRTA